MGLGVRRPIELLVLAGGFGTRLRSVVSEVPKALAPVGGKPYLHFLIERWLEQGVTKLTFLLHHQADLIEAFLDSCYRAGLFRDCALDTLVEREPLGTGGAVANAVQHFCLGGPFLVTNADTWLGGGIQSMVEFVPPAMVVVQVRDSGRFGSVRVEHGKVVAFAEKKSCSGSGWINAGLYYLNADLFKEWNGKSFSLEHGMFPDLACAGKMRAVPLTTDFIDIGVPEDYYRFCRWVESGKVGTP